MTDIPMPSRIVPLQDIVRYVEDQKSRQKLQELSYSTSAIQRESDEYLMLHQEREDPFYIRSRPF